MRFERTYGKTNQNYRTFNNCYLCIANFFSGIERDKTMADDLMYIPNDGTQNYPFCRLQLLVESPQSFQRSLQWIRKHYHKTLGTIVIKSPMSPPSPTTILFFFQRKRGQWVVYYTSPQIIIKMFSYSLAFQLWAL